MNPDHYFDFKLTEEQKDAFRQLCSFAEDENSKVFILKGYAGTGKSTLTGGYARWLKENNKKYYLLASTGRAAKILSNKTKDTVQTVHSLIYAFAELDDDLEEMEKSLDQMSVDHKGQINLIFNALQIFSSEQRIYLIDEASMISDVKGDSAKSFAKYGSGHLLADLFQFDPNGKFIFIGDPLQLPPINQKISPALTAEYIETKYGYPCIEIELQNVLRQAKDNDLLHAAMELRKLYERNPPGKWAFFYLKGYKHIHIKKDANELADQYFNKIKDRDFEKATLICHSNHYCQGVNEYIRKRFNYPKNQIKEGELLLVTQNNYLVPLMNGDLVEVMALGESEYRAGLTFRKCEVKELVSQKKYKLLLIEDILYGRASNLNSQQHLRLWIDFAKRMKTAGIKQKDPGFNEMMLKDPYLNGLRSVFGYSLTCHKSQGGEWDEVFLFIDNKIQGFPRPEVYRWLYTAITRSRHLLHLPDVWYIKQKKDLLDKLYWLPPIRY